MIKLAVMQGRLSPPENGRFQSFPKSSWQEEFPKAVKAGIPAIEWIDDTYGGEDNPLRSDEGVKQIQMLMEKHGVTVPSICADSFMEEPLIRCSDSERTNRLQLLQRLFVRAKDLCAEHLTIPFLDHSALNSNEERSAAIKALKTIIPTLEICKVELHLEMSLDPESLKAFFEALNHPLVRVTYDTGNSASLGFDPHEEFAAYGEYIGSVHIKDRVKSGGTVELGTGDTDFFAVREELQKIRFAGIFTLQAARSKDGDEVAHLVKCREFAEKWFESSSMI
jgi:L-ribulose-5-phosphate 3-epimerase